MRNPISRREAVDEFAYVPNYESSLVKTTKVANSRMGEPIQTEIEPSGGWCFRRTRTWSDSIINGVTTDVDLLVACARPDLMELVSISVVV